MLSNRIVCLRKNNGLNQLQLAQKLHISPSTIGMYEQGRRMPSIDILVKMAKVFNVSLDYIITGSEYVLGAEIQNMSSTSCDYTCCGCCCRNSSMRAKMASCKRYVSSK